MADFCPPWKRGDFVVNSDFTDVSNYPLWVGQQTFRPTDDGTRAMHFHSSSSAQSVLSTYTIPVVQVQGCCLYFECSAQSLNVSKPSISTQGVVFTVACESPTAGLSFSQIGFPTGTFSRQTGYVCVYVPTDATELTMNLGLQGVTGSVSFINPVVKIWKPPPPRPVNVPPKTPYTGHTLPRLRGASMGIPPESGDVAILGQPGWGADVVRWQMQQPVGYDNSNPATPFMTWVENVISQLDFFLPSIAAAGLLVLVDMHTPPGVFQISENSPTPPSNIWINAQTQAEFIAGWQYIAKHYAGDTRIWGYDILNEANERYAPPGLMDWQQLAEATANAINAIDSSHALIIEAPITPLANGIQYLVPLSATNCVYSFHMYLPLDYTNQQFANGAGYTPPPSVYPGVIDGVEWNSTMLAQAMQPAVNFAADYSVQIFVGEFSAVRWAESDSAVTYISDCINFFESQGWDWSYFAFRDPAFTGGLAQAGNPYYWDASFDTNMASTQPAASPTDRQLLLQSWFAQNEYP